MTIGLTTRKRWRVVLFCSLILSVGYIPGSQLFTITSSIGELVMLIGASFLVYLVQEDLFLAGSFADYLHKSNLAFRQADELQQLGNTTMASVMMSSADND